MSRNIEGPQEKCKRAENDDKQRANEYEISHKAPTLASGPPREKGAAPSVQTELL
jgi:hypothetical protein